MPEPLLIEVTRGPLVESRHLVDAVVVDGDHVTSHGDPDGLVHPRSAVKLVQALPLVESGAADAFGVSPAELALACASHSGEAAHIAGVSAWLDRLGLDESSLECGAQRGRPAGAVANNCSGKHAGFLTLARHLGIDPTGYIHPDHPVQQAVFASMSSAFGLDVDPALLGVDGCGMAVVPMSLTALATGMATAAAAPGASAAHRLATAMRAHPHLVAGTDLLDTWLMEDVDDIIAKTGAEGVYVVAATDRPWAVAVKARDGAPRAAEAATLHLLHAAGYPTSDRLQARSTIRNWAGTPVGEIRVGEIRCV